MAKSFEARYPNITRWVESRGWIEIGKAEYSESLIRAFDEGGDGLGKSGQLQQFGSSPRCPRSQFAQLARG
jgi:hypothetical protein